MQLTTQTAPASKAKLWAGRVISALLVLFLLFDSIIKVIQIAPATESLNQLGYPVGLTLGIGLLGLVCVVIVPVLSQFA